MKLVTDGSSNTPKTPKRGFFDYCFAPILAFLKKEDKTVGTKLFLSLTASILAVITASVLVIININKDKKPNISVVTDNHSTNAPIINSRTDIKNVIFNTDPSNITIKKGTFIKNRHLSVSTNLDGISEVLEKKLNAPHIKTNLSGIVLIFSQYPKSKIYKYPDTEYARLDSGALVNVEVKNTGFNFNIPEPSIHEIQKNPSVIVADKMNKEIIVIVKQKNKFIVDKLTTWLQKN